MSLFGVLGVFVGGGVGAWCRFAADAFLKSTLGSVAFIRTMLINLAGSFALGVLTGWASTAVSTDVEHWILLVGGTGFLGGFTTFSTAMVEVATLAREGRVGIALFLWLGQAVLGLLVAWAGLLLGVLSAA